MKRWFTAVALGLALGAVVACAVGAPTLREGSVPTGPGISLIVKPVPLNPKDPAQDRIGSFVYAGGIHVSSGVTDLLHGLSDLDIKPDGALASVSDQGSLFQARLVLDASGWLTGLTDARLYPLKGLDGQGVQGKLESDAEGVAVWPNGDVMVSFERHHRIWLYPAAGGPPRDLPMPDASTLPPNDGFEGLALAPSQGPDAYWVGVENGDIFLCRLAAACERKAALPRPPVKYRMAAITETPGGQLVALYDSWGPFSGAIGVITLIDGPASAAPKVIDRFTIGPPLTTDNWEGLATAALPGGGFRLYLIVDDNFSPSERTLLMAFDRIPKP